MNRRHSGGETNGNGQPVITDIAKTSTDTLWQGLSLGGSPIQRTCILRELIARVARKPQPCMLSGNSINKLVNILRGTQLPSDCLCLAAVLLGLCLNVGDFRKAAIKADALKHLLDIIALSKASLSSLETELLKKVTALVLFFSQPDGPVVCQAALFNNKAVAVLTKLCRYGNGMYHMSSRSTVVLDGLTKGKNLIGDVQRMPVEILDNAYCLYVGEGHRHMRLNGRGYVLTLFDTNGPTDVNINEEMFNSHAVTNSNTNPRTESDATSENSNSGGNFQDIRVTSVVNGAFFWAQVGVGGAVSSTVHTVKQILEEWPEPERQYLTREPMVGQFICAQTDGIGCFRAQVLSVDGSDRITVLGFDHGVFTVPWKGAFYLQAEMGLKSYEPQAVLCRLKGVGPVVRSTEVICNALNTLCNMASNTDRAGEMFGDSSMLLQLQHLCRYPDSQIQCSMFRLLSNLGRRPKVRRMIGTGTSFIPTIVEACRAVDLETSSSEEEVDILVTALSALSNLIFDTAVNKAIFVDCEGVQVALHLLWCTQSKVKAAALGMLRVLLGNARFVRMTSIKSSLDTFPRNKSDVDKIMQITEALASRNYKGANAGHRSPVESHNRERGRARSRSKSRSRSQQGSDGGGRNSSPGYGLGRARSLTRRRMLEMEASSDEEETNQWYAGEKCDSPRTAESNRVSPKPDNNQNDIATFEKTKETPPSKRNDTVVKIADTAKCYVDSQAQNKYIQGYTVQFRNDNRHEVRRNTHLLSISSLTIAKLAVGFLNARRGGSIYFGIDLGTGKVRGIPASRGERDDFRQGIDSAFSKKVNPPLLVTLYDVFFSPAVSPDTLYQENTEHRAVTNNYVIEICLNRNHGTVYTVENKVFMREGPQTVQYSTQEMHEWTVNLHERRHLEDMKALQMDVDRLRSELGISKGAKLHDGSALSNHLTGITGVS